ncbi:hypothetical protein EFP53_13375 [Lacticaseibacillus paracasei]|nr:hypothetical protein [Lacticaseibacillus paracasei]MCT3338774.1 hypothetical protein [Lacticaseibacillus paracasei]MCT3354093.1 hypothetical protein [Lacticaseibacillus paracasei]
MRSLARQRMLALSFPSISRHHLNRPIAQQKNGEPPHIKESIHRHQTYFKSSILLIFFIYFGTAKPTFAPSKFTPRSTT